MDSYGDSTALAAAYLIAALTWFIFAVVFYVLGSLFLMKIFEKAGVEGKGRAGVPFYNIMVFLKLAIASLGIGVVAFFAAFYAHSQLGYPNWTLSVMYVSMWMIAGGAIPLFITYTIAMMFGPDNNSGTSKTM